MLGKYPFRVTRKYRIGSAEKFQTKNFEKLTSAMICYDNLMTDRLTVSVELVVVLSEDIKKPEQRYSDQYTLWMAKKGKEL
jgi:hypothetical protein